MIAASLARGHRATRRAVRRVVPFAVAGTWLIAGCAGGGDGFVTVQPPPAVSVTLAPGSATVSVGNSTSFAVSITGGSPTPSLSSCSSSNSAVATVTVNGSSCVATGVSAGNATITATASGGQTGTAQITVAGLPPALTGFTLTPATGKLVVGQTAALTATPVSAAGATVTVSYSSANPSIASVSAAGVVTGVSPGTVVITATAQGTGTGLTSTTLSRTSSITVERDPCAPIVIAALPFARSGSVTSGSCVLPTANAGRGDLFRINLAAASAIEVTLTPTGFAPYITVLQASETESVSNSRSTPAAVTGRWHLPAGLTEIRVGALNPTGTGNYDVQVQSVSASVENCSAVVVAGTLFSVQALQNTDCLNDGFLSDEFIVYSSKPCVISMLRGTSTSLANAMDDPFLYLLAGSDTIAMDDDGAGAGNARLSLASCRSASNNVLRIRASSFDRGDLGTYRMVVDFSAAAVSGDVQAGVVSSIPGEPVIEASRVEGATPAASTRAARVKAAKPSRR